MISDILIAVGFFVVGFFVGGGFALSKCWETMRKQKKQILDAQKKYTVIIHDRI